MTKSLGLIALMFALSSAASTQAAPVLTLQPAGPVAIGVGGSASYDLVLLSPDAVIGAFSVDLSFDSSVLHFTPAVSPAAQFGAHLGDPLLEAIGAAGESSPGVLHLDQVSLLDAAGLEALQGGGALLPSLVLATLTFEGIGPGLGLLDFLPASLQFSNADGNLLPTPDALPIGSVQVIPEPATMALALLALAASGLGSRRRLAARLRAPLEG